jgi:hypothetical protein
MHRLIAFWHGEEPLPTAFWNWAVIGGILVNVATSALFLALIMHSRPTLALLIGYGVSLPYNLFATVGVWRSADRYEGERKWADLAKTATVIGMLLLSLT